VGLSLCASIEDLVSCRVFFKDSTGEKLLRDAGFSWGFFVIEALWEVLGEKLEWESTGD
jgi:hypothetical protein